MNFPVVLGVIISMLGVILVFDARLLTKKLFSFGDQNEGSLGLKIFGFILIVIGCLLVYFNM